MQEATFASLAIRGRDAALDILTEQLDRVRSGVGAVVLVEGAPGDGKEPAARGGGQDRWPDVVQGWQRRRRARSRAWSSWRR